MANNKPLRKFFALELLVSKLVAGLVGWQAWLGGFILNIVFRYAARQGIYMIDIAGVNIRTNMGEDLWLKINGEAWEKVEAGGLTEEEGKDIDDKFIKALDDFTVFKKVKR